MDDNGTKKVLKSLRNSHTRNGIEGNGDRERRRREREREIERECERERERE